MWIRAFAIVFELRVAESILTQNIDIIDREKAEEMYEELVQQSNKDSSEPEHKRPVQIKKKNRAMSERENSNEFSVGFSKNLIAFQNLKE